MACHIRSTSLPKRSHPFVLKAEEELNKLKARVASPSLSYEIMLDAIKAVGHVYECINDILCISSIRDALSYSKQKRFVDQELEESIKLIDICSTSRDTLDLINGQLQDLESALRRGESAVRKSESTVVDSSDVASILLESREVTISLLQSIFSLVFDQA